MDYYRYVSEGLRPTVVVVEDLDGETAFGAFWGEINATVHKAFGLEGAVTNGAVRDLGVLPAGFPVLAGTIGVSHGHVHVVSVDVPVAVKGLRVNAGDLVHADRHGAVVIPRDLIEEMLKALAKMTDAEEIVLGPARSAGPDYGFEDFRKSWEEFEAARI